MVNTWIWDWLKWSRRQNSLGVVYMIDQNLSLVKLAEETANRFEVQYGRRPEFVVAAPGRVNLIGEHTDYNDGFVMPMAIERYTMLAAARPKGPQSDIRWHCTRMNEEAVIPLRQPIEQGTPKWSNYVRGVLSGFMERGINPGPLDVLMLSNVPLGGGLSSSAALEVASATLFEAVTGRTLDPVEKALACQKAEHDYAGVPCGIMDQFISVMGRKDHLLLLDCRSKTTQLVPLSDPGVSVLIINSEVHHELAGGEYAKRRAQCETAARVIGVRSLRDASMTDLKHCQKRMEEVTWRRAHHVIGENERTLAAATALHAGQWDAAGQLMYASHASLRDDYEVSCKELDILVDIAQGLGASHGVIGSRMTGGGFGGCTVTLAKTDAVQRVAEHIGCEYERKTRIKPSMFVSRPGEGATILKA